MVEEGGVGVEKVAVCLAGHGWGRGGRGSWGVWSGVCGERVERGRLRCRHVDHGRNVLGGLGCEDGWFSKCEDVSNGLVGGDDGDDRLM